MDFIQTKSIWSLPYYPVTQGQAGMLGFSSKNGLGFTATILDSNDNWRNINVPNREAETVLVFNDFNFNEIKGFSFSSENSVEELKIHAVQGAPTHIIGSSEIEGIDLEIQPGGGVSLLGLDQGWTETPVEDRILEVNYSMKTEVVDSVLLYIEGQGLSREYDFFPRKEGGTINFYVRDLGFTPESIECSGWKIESVTFKDLNTDAIAPMEPFTADTGTILHFPQEAWRNEDFEAFKWTLFPNILYITTSDYAVQANFFKRLAFFVEKKGYTGTLVPNEILKHRFGWNAHDYSSESLAAFFNLAEEENFQLNYEEEVLKEICQNAGIISQSAEGWVPGNGAVIGTSLETGYEQRLIFMTHESIHGLYFINEEFRQLCADFWPTLPEEQQKFWINFLSYRGYNVVEDEELLFTEVTAYLLQQPPEAADDYLIGFISPTILKKRPLTQEWLIPYFMANRTPFSDSVCCIGEEMEMLYGLNATSFHELLPVKRSHWSPFTGLKDEWYTRQDN